MIDINKIKASQPRTSAYTGGQQAFRDLRLTPAVGKTAEPSVSDRHEIDRNQLSGKGNGG